MAGVSTHSGEQLPTEPANCPCLSVELIPDALDGLDAVVADLFAELADVHIDGAVADEELVALDLAVDLVALEHLAGLADQ